MQQLQLKIGLVIANQGLSSEVQACLKDLPARVLLQQPSLGDPALFLKQLEQLHLDALLLDLTQIKEPFDQVVRAIKSVPGAPMIVALSATADPEIILGAIRAGANEFLYPPLEAGLHKALERLAAERAQQFATARQRGKTLAFFSAKGGCGATTIACHVAVEMQRATGQEVLLADFDMDSGLVGFLMKAKSQYSMADAVKNVHRLDMSYWRALVSNGQAHLEMITAPPTATNYGPTDPETFRDVIRFMRTAYDWVVADLGRGVNTLSLNLLDELDEAYLISTLDMPSLHQAKQIVQALFDAGYSRNRLHLILNRMPKRPDFDSGEMQRVLGVPIYEMLPNDYPELYQAYAEGNLLSGNSDLGKSLSALAWKIAGVQPKEKEKGKSRSSLSIF